MPVHNPWTTRWYTFHLTFIFHHLLYKCSFLHKRNSEQSQESCSDISREITQQLQCEYKMQQYILGNLPSPCPTVELGLWRGVPISLSPTRWCCWKQIQTYQHETYEVFYFSHLCAIQLHDLHCILALPELPCFCFVQAWQQAKFQNGYNRRRYILWICV